MKKYLIYSLLFTTFLSCERMVGEINYRLSVRNDSNIEYQVQYNNNRIIDTVLVAYVDVKPTVRLSYVRFAEQDLELPKYTNEQFLEEVKSLKVFRIIEGDTIYYGGSIDYSLNEDNWYYFYNEDSGIGLHDYILRLGID